MNESWDCEDVGAKEKPQAGDWPIISRVVRWRYYSVAFGLVMPVVCFALEFVLLPALGWLPGLVFFHRYRLFGYGVVALGLVALAIWLKLGHRLRCLTTRAALREVIAGDDATSQAAVGRLRPYWWLADFDPLRRAYQKERDPTRRKRFARAYRELTAGAIWTGPTRFIEYGGPDRLLED